MTATITNIKVPIARVLVLIVNSSIASWYLPGSNVSPSQLTIVAFDASCSLTSSETDIAGGGSCSSYSSSY